MKCSHCGNRDKGELMKISVNKYGVQYYICRSCQTIRLKEYRKTLNGKIATKRAVIKYEKNHQQKRKVWNIAQVIPRRECIKCGREDSVRHHEDIKKPKEVIMLCHFHHRLVHRQGSMV